MWRVVVVEDLLHADNSSSDQQAEEGIKDCPREDEYPLLFLGRIDKATIALAMSGCGMSVDQVNRQMVNNLSWLYKIRSKSIRIRPHIPHSDIDEIIYGVYAKCKVEKKMGNMALAVKEVVNLHACTLEMYSLPAVGVQVQEREGRTRRAGGLRVGRSKSYSREIISSSSNNHSRSSSITILVAEAGGMELRQKA